MAIMAITQDGGGTSKEYVTFYSCGDKGHYAGNEECTKHGCIAPSAPDRYRGSGTKGKCKGGPQSGRAEVKAKARAKKQPIQWLNQEALLVFQYQWHL